MLGRLDNMSQMFELPVVLCWIFMCRLMLLLFFKVLVAVRADGWSETKTSLARLSQIACFGKRSSTLITQEGLGPCVLAHVGVSGSSLREGRFTDCALEGPFSRMCPRMIR